MKCRLRLLAIVLILGATAATSRQKEQAQSSSPCGVIDQALRDYSQLRPGVLRKDVEKYFEREGGLQFPGTTHYVYPKCPYLHVDLEFEVKGKTDTLFSPEDIVVTASKLYVGYSVKD